MTKDELWKIYVAKNPRFDQPEEMITMPARSLKKLFDQTWEQATKSANGIRDVVDRFDKMFGGR